MKTFVITLILSFGMIVFIYPKPTSAADSMAGLPGYRFAFLNHPRREFTEEEAQYIANNYDLAVIGFQSDPMIASATRVKQINPNIKLFVYFPTSIRQTGARYGIEEFKESWYLHDFEGNRITKGEGGTLEHVDLTNADYITWAGQTAIDFVNDGAYDGIVYDNANPIGIVGNNKDGWLEFITQEKIDAWNSALVKYLRNMATRFNNRGKIMIYNGINRSPQSKINRTLSHMDITNGALYEKFCSPQTEGKNDLLPKEQQLEDIDLMQTYGNQGKFILHKVNWYGLLHDLPVADQNRFGRYCFGIFLMGHVPGYTFFKFGDGYNLFARPEEYRTNAEEINLPLGNPTRNYQRKDWLLSRRFQNGWVLLNLGDTKTSWIAPEKLEVWNHGKYQQTIAAGDIYSLKANDAAYFLKPGVQPSPSPSPILGDINTDGVVNILDQTLLSNAFGTNNTAADLNTDGTVNILDYTILSTNFGKSL